MSALRFWFVSLTMTLLCGCGRQSAPPTAPPTPPAQAVIGRSDTDIPVATGQRPAEEAIDAARPPAAALAELRATLDRAFETLRQQGIVAEPKFEGDVRNAVVAMSELLEQRNAPGGVYWHEQDDENLERGEDLNIGFVGREDRDAVAIGQELVAALKAEGLTVEWDGSADKRVTVNVALNQPEATAANPPLIRLERVAQIPGTEQGLQGDLAVQGKYVYWTLAGRCPGTVRLRYGWQQRQSN